MLRCRVALLRRMAIRYLSSLPEHKEIIMPKVSPTMTAGRLVSWKKQEGEAFEEGEDIADVESDKATMPISAREDGFMAKILVGEDSPEIPLGEILAITVEEEELIPAFKDYALPSEAEKETPVPAAAPSATDTAPPSTPQTQSPSPAQAQYTGPKGPAVMRLLNEFPSLNLSAIVPTGPQGRMLKGDILAAIEAGTAFQAAPASAPPLAPPAATKADTAATADLQLAEVDGMPAHTDVPVTSMRRAIAKRLVLSKAGVPHRYASSSYELDNLLAMRQRLNSMGPPSKISVNDFMIRAIAIALRRVPEMNVSWDEGSQQVVYNENVDISMAVAIEGGLITPIVTRADSRGLADIAKTTKDLVARAKGGTLAPEEFEGGSFSVSNLGMFGISKFSAIINPPQSGILAVGSGFQRAVLNEDNTLSTVTEGTATLSTDARAVEEKTAAEFLNEYSKCISNPESMLM